MTTPTPPPENDPGAPEPNGRDTPNRSAKINGVTAVIGLVTAIAVFIATVATEPWWQGVGNRIFGRSPSVEIGSPRAGMVVDHQIQISGEAKNIPKGEALIFVTLAITEGNRYHPGNTSCIPGTEGSFVCPPYFVGQAKHAGGPASYRILAVLADAETREKFANYNLETLRTKTYPGMTELPESAKEVDSVEVSRVS